MVTQTAQTMTVQKLAAICFPIQEYGTIYSPCDALRAGTVFPALAMPYTCCNQSHGKKK